jgi:DNA-binding CsgD family transcriptional regulator
MKQEIAKQMCAEGCTLQQIGTRLGCSREYARLLLQKLGLKTCRALPRIPLAERQQEMWYRTVLS